MASSARRLPTNVDGDFFVDDTCIDCGTCRWVAPATFDYEAGAARVFRQPGGEEETRRALMASVACPTASIGFSAAHDVRSARDGWPEALWIASEGPPGAGVYHCGFHAEQSFGAASYLIVRPAGNVLVDSPRFNRPLARKIAALGGARHLFLTHKDDVADHERWAEEFGCERILHRADVGPGTRGVERVIEGSDPISLDEELVIIPVPGHTRGSACLLYRGSFLFSGDHLAFSRELGHLYAFRGACWFSWPKLVRSTERLFAEHRFTWVLPGHGRRYQASALDEMEEQKARCLAWMQER